jgi:hypothetical protein
MLCEMSIFHRKSAPVAFDLTELRAVAADVKAKADDFIKAFQTFEADKAELETIVADLKAVAQTLEANKPQAPAPVDARPSGNITQEPPAV